MTAVVQINNLSKKFGDFTAVNNLSLEIKQNECFGFLGPFGSGKSTLMKSLYGVTPIHSGEAFILGLNIKDHDIEIKSRIGILPQSGGVDPDLTVIENLQVFSRFYDLQAAQLNERAAYLLRFLRLEDKVDKAVYELPLESVRRVSLARSLINSPDLLMIDDFFVGLESKYVEEFVQIFKTLKSEGMTLIMSSQNYTELEKLCDRVGLMDHGRLLISGSPGSLKQELIGQEVLEFDCKPADMNYYLQKIREQGFEYQVYHNTVNIFIKHPKTMKDAYNLVSSDRMLLRKPHLGDVFLRLSGALLEARP